MKSAKKVADRAAFTATPATVLPVKGLPRGGIARPRLGSRSFTAPWGTLGGSQSHLQSKCFRWLGHRRGTLLKGAGHRNSPGDTHGISE